MVNAAMESITGYSREELMAMEELEHIHRITALLRWSEAPPASEAKPFHPDTN